MISARMTGEWRNVVTEMRALSMTTRSVAIKRAVAQEAHHWAKEIKGGLRTQKTAKMASPPWAPLSASTLAARVKKRKKARAAKPKKKGKKRETSGARRDKAKRPKRKPAAPKMLIDTGTMLRSIGVDRIGPFAYFVGVKRGAKTADGEEVVNVAAVHEYGTTRAGRTGTTVIPPRPFIKPWEDELKKGLNDRLYERYWNQVKRIMTKRFVKMRKMP